MFKKGNKYEIIQFIVDQSKKSLGLSVAEKPMSILDEYNDDHDDSGCHSDGGDPMEELPEKVDMFLDYINSLYFDGQLDMKSSKKAFLSNGDEKLKVRFKDDDFSDEGNSSNDEEDEGLSRKRPILRTE